MGDLATKSQNLYCYSNSFSLRQVKPYIAKREGLSNRFEFHLPDFSDLFKVTEVN